MQLQLIFFCFVLREIVQGQQWSRHIVLQAPRGNVRELAEDYNLRLLSNVFPESHVYHFWSPSFNSAKDSWEFLEELRNDPRVEDVEVQTYMNRDARTSVPRDDFGNSLPILRTSNDLSFNDPMYPFQWYLHNGQDDLFKRHLNVVPVWKRGFTGKGVKVSILDGGLDHQHADLAPHYDADISGNVSDPEQESDNPLPSGESETENHGTYCAGIVAAVANNSVCGVGVAYQAAVGGVKLLTGGRVTDVQEATALNYRLRDVDIYSASWGPPDDGQHVGKPGPLASRALRRGVEHGRNGKGVIYVWASGNGGRNEDNCNLDGYASSIYTLTVSSLTAEGLSPAYAEPCASTIASVYVGGARYEPSSLVANLREMRTVKVVVPEGEKDCKDTFQGTSAAAPLAAGVVALLLEANPYLTWRDVQHVFVRTSKPPNFEDGWVTNGAGLQFHPLYGFGALDAAAVVAMGSHWKPVPPQKSLSFACEPESIAIFPKKSAYGKVWADCADSGDCMETLEHVTLSLSLKHPHRGELSMALTSPSGTRSELLTKRSLDREAKGLKDWTLATVHFWGENPQGLWTISMYNHGIGHGSIAKCMLTLYGT